jgi:O-acetyl-ADP-ribose deacetylase (regulator of RNase III)
MPELHVLLMEKLEVRLKTSGINTTNKDQITKSTQKHLRYMEEVDAKITEAMDDKEAYIVDGSGNPVQLGSE